MAKYLLKINDLTVKTVQNHTEFAADLRRKAQIKATSAQISG
jgi:hypothetical protein